MQFVLSDDERFAYRVGTGPFGFWLQFDRQPIGAVAAKVKKNTYLEGVQLSHPETQELYEREILPFVFWKVQRNNRKFVDLAETDLFVQDYLGIEKGRNSL